MKKIESMNKNILLYLFTFSFKDGNNYIKILAKDNINIQILEEEIDIFFSGFNLEEFKLFYIFLYSQLRKYNIRDIGFTFGKIFSYILGVKEYKGNEIYELLNFVKNIINKENDFYNGYYEILISFAGIGNCYLYKNKKIIKYIISEFKFYKNDFNNIPDYKANCGLYLNKLYQMYKRLTDEEYNKLMEEKLKNNEDFKIYGKYKWYGEFLD